MALKNQSVSSSFIQVWIHTVIVLIQIFKTSQFDTDEKIISDFYNSPEVPLQQILSSNAIHGEFQWREE
jgi:hypothetical protein